MTSQIKFESPWFGQLFRVYDGHVMIGEQPLMPAGAGHGAPDTGGGSPVTDIGQDTVIHSDQTLDFHYNWRVKGFLNGIDFTMPGVFPGLVDPVFWEIKTYVEGVGGFFEGLVDTRYEPFQVGQGVDFTSWYVRTIPIPPPGGPGGTWPAGVYDIVTTVQMVGYDGTNVTERLPVAGFAEMGKVQIYDA